MPIGPARMPLFDHLGELRMRLVRIVACLGRRRRASSTWRRRRLSGFSIWPISDILQMNTDGQGLLTTLDPFEGFSVRFKVSLWASRRGMCAGHFVADPRVLPAGAEAQRAQVVHPHVRRCGGRCSCFGTVFCYLIILNPAFQWLVDQAAGFGHRSGAHEHLHRHHHQVRARLRLRVRAAAHRVLPGHLRRGALQEAARQLAYRLRGAHGHFGHGDARRVARHHAAHVRRHGGALRGKPAHLAHRAGQAHQEAERRSWNAKRPRNGARKCTNWAS